MRALLAVLALAACGDNRTADAPAADAPASRWPLGMNDVSILAPLADPLGAARDYLPEEAYTELVPAYNDVGNHQHVPFAFDDFRLVALRFDLCARSEVGPCPPVANGRLRLVFQPVYADRGAPSTLDLALHAFYPIRYDEVDGVIGELRALAALAGTPLGEPLEVSPPLAAGNAAYRARLLALVRRYATPRALVRLTTIGQLDAEAAAAWVMRGVDVVDGAYPRMVIPQVMTYAQEVDAGGGVFALHPLADEPRDLAMAIDTREFARAAPHDQYLAYQALLDVQNPKKHDAVDTQCAACHVANRTTWQRVAYLGGARPTDVGDSFASPGRNLAVTSAANTNPQIIRAFGYYFAEPIVTLRVANDTAEVLDEIDARVK